MSTFTLSTPEPSHKAFLVGIEGLNVFTFGDTPPAGQKTHVWCNNSPHDRLKAILEIRRLEAGGCDVWQIDEAAVADKAALVFDQDSELSDPDSKGLAHWLASFGVLINDPESVRKHQSKILAELEILSIKPRLKDWIEAIKTASPAAQKRLIKDAGQALGVSASDIKKELSLLEATPENELFTDIEPYHQAVNPTDVLNEIDDCIKRFVVLHEHQAVIMTLWVVMTWFSKQLNVAPNLIVTAPEKECGKSVCLSVLGYLAYRPLQNSGITSAVIYRLIEMCSPTILIDEIDRVLKDKNTNEALIGVLNAGHDRRGAYSYKCDGKNNEPKRFACFGPKAFAGIDVGGFLDGTILSRSFVVTLERKSDNEKSDDIYDTPESYFNDLASKIARLASDVTLPAQVEMPSWIYNRAKQNAKPLFQIAILAGVEWVDKLTKALKWLYENVDTSPSASVELLTLLKSMFTVKETDRLHTSFIIDQLCEDETGRWVGYDKGNRITPRQIAKLLKRYGVKPATFRVVTNGKGYYLTDLKPVFEKYIPNIPSNIRNSVTDDLEATTGAGFDVTDTQKISVTVTDKKDISVTPKSSTGADDSGVLRMLRQNEGVTDTMKNLTKVRV